MEDKEMMRRIKDALANDAEIRVYDWPDCIPPEAGKQAFYVETGEHGSVKRFWIQVEEFARFQAGNAYF